MGGVRAFPKRGERGVRRPALVAHLPELGDTQHPSEAQQGRGKLVKNVLTTSAGRRVLLPDAAARAGSPTSPSPAARARFRPRRAGAALSAFLSEFVQRRCAGSTGGAWPQAVQAGSRVAQASPWPSRGTGQTGPRNGAGSAVLACAHARACRGPRVVHSRPKTLSLCPERLLSPPHARSQRGPREVGAKCFTAQGLELEELAKLCAANLAVTGTRGVARMVGFSRLWSCGEEVAMEFNP